MRESTDEVRAQVAWVVTQKSIKEALAYDIRIMPRDLLTDHMRRIEEAAKLVIDEIWGEKMSQAQWERLKLPGPLGGCGMRMPDMAAEAALIATHAAIKERVRSFAEVQGWKIGEIAGTREVDKARENRRELKRVR